MKFFFLNSRSALNFALQNKKYKYLSKSILLPDYICEEMIDFFKKKSFKISFYKIKKNLEPDLFSLKKKHTENFSFLLFVHFFGYPQNINKFKNFSKKRNLILIEDNAHGYGGLYNGKVLGNSCEFGISSPHKTIKGLYSGGVLYGKFKKHNLKKYNPNIFVKLKRFIKIMFPSILIIKKILNPFINFEVRTYESLKIDDYSFKKLNRINLNKLRLIKKDYFQDLSKILEKNNIRIVHKNYDSQLNPWFLIVERSKKYEKKLLNISKENNFELISWPAKFKKKGYEKLNSIKKEFYFIDLSFRYDGNRSN